MLLDEDLRAAGFTAEARKWPRDEVAFRLLCAFSGVKPEQAPEAWRYFPNEWVSSAWGRVAEEAKRICEERS